MPRFISRRKFIKSSSLFGLFSIFPACVLVKPGQAAPSDKLNIAAIGFGGKGPYNIKSMASENIFAVCDVDSRHIAKGVKAYPSAKGYSDYRKLFDKEKSIDAVMIATPDNTHAIITMAALERGKAIYCEKPLTHDVYEARKVAQAAKKAGVATQMGNQGMASEKMRIVREMIEDGAIGDVREVVYWTDRPVWPQGMLRPKDSAAVPSYLNWDIWQGPAADRPFHSSYLHFVWRGWQDFGTGTMGDIGGHLFGGIFYTLGLRPPEYVEGTSSRLTGGWRHVTNNDSYPRASMVRWRFPAVGGKPAIKLSWYDGGLKPERPELLEASRKLGKGGLFYIGDKGVIRDTRLLPEKKMKEYKLPAKKYPRSVGHYEEWLLAAKGQGNGCGSDFVTAGHATEAALLGNIALKHGLQGERLYWDHDNMKFTNNDEANRYIQRQYRKGWTL
ncbi:MAG: Gfo/Idh/MocA family oxidoreductase [Planctomycetes bacterium]|nr:Gfo/Idh/MocA family oxidoreductase [Planctomycetota bacterium]